jgi:hypothetical protein
MQAQLVRLARAERLRREGERAHAQKSEQPEQAVEQEGRHGDAAEQCGVAKAADHAGRDDADQRRRQVRDHRGSRDGEDPRGRDAGGGTRRVHAYNSTTMPSWAAV